MSWRDRAKKVEPTWKDRATKVEQEDVFPEPTRIEAERPPGRFDSGEAAMGFSVGQDLPVIGPLGQRLGEGFRAGLESAFGEEDFGQAYDRIRAENEAKEKKYARENPALDTTSKVIGALGVGGFGNAATIPGRIATSGAITGVDTLAQTGDLMQSGKDAGLGAGVQAGVEALVPVAKAARPYITSKGLEDIAGMRALKSIYGNVTKAWNETPEAQRIPMGLAALKNKIVGFGTTAGGAVDCATKVGKKNWKGVEDTFSKMDEAGVGVSGDDIAEEISAATQKIPPIPKNKNIINQMAEEGEYYAGKTLTPSEAQALKRQYKFKMVDPSTHVLGQEGNTLVNQALAKSIRNSVAGSGLPNAGKFADDYELAGQIASMKRFGKVNADRMTKNRSLSLTDYIGALGVGGIVGGASENVGAGGTAAVLMAIANNMGRKRGSSAIAKTLYEAAQVMKKSPASSAKILDALERGELIGPMGAMIADEIKAKLAPVSEETNSGANVDPGRLMRDDEMLGSGLEAEIPGRNKGMGMLRNALSSVFGDSLDTSMDVADLLVPESYGEFAPGMAALPPNLKKGNKIDFAGAKKFLEKKKAAEEVADDFIPPNDFAKQTLVEKDGVYSMEEGIKNNPFSLAPDPTPMEVITPRMKQQRNIENIMRDDGYVGMGTVWGKKLKPEDLKDLGYWEPKGNEFGISAKIGGIDPFAWMDTKSGHAKRVLEENRSKPLNIYTRSDLIAHDDYIDALGPGHKVKLIVPGYNDRVHRVLSGSDPSAARIMKAAQKLKDSGVDVELIVNKIAGIPNDPDRLKAISELGLKSSGMMQDLDAKTRKTVESVLGDYLRDIKRVTEE